MKVITAVFLMLSFFETSDAESWTKDDACQECNTGVIYKFYIEMPRDKAWEKLRDLTLAPNYVPGVERIEMLAEKKQGIGTSRRIYPKKMIETVIEWNEGFGFVLKLHKSNGKAPAPFKTGAFRYSISDYDKGTEFTLTLMYKIRWYFLGRISDRLFMRFFIKRVVRDIGLSMRYFYLTGEPVTPEILKKLKKDG